METECDPVKKKGIIDPVNMRYERYKEKKKRKINKEKREKIPRDYRVLRNVMQEHMSSEGVKRSPVQSFHQRCLQKGFRNAKGYFYGFADLKKRKENTVRHGEIVKSKDW